MVTVKELSNRINGKITCGDSTIVLKTVLPLDKAGMIADTLSWVSAKNLSVLNDKKAGVYIVPKGIDVSDSHAKVYIEVENPRLAFLKAVTFYFNEQIKYSIDKSASIAEGVDIPSDVFIGKNVVIEEGCQIGNKTYIGHNTVIMRNTVIGSAVIIGSNCTIGGVGFGYEKDELGEYCLIPHLGNVVLEDNVEIGNSTCIDRAVLGSTTIKKNAKIDNLVNIAHGVVVGNNSLIIANAMIAGSVIIGANSWIAPSSSVLNKIKLGNDVTVGMGAVVLKDVCDNDVVVGIPAKSIKKETEI